MFKVIYHWQVPQENFDAFQAEWKATTEHIHLTEIGALGSTMLRSMHSPEKVLTIAKWTNESAWQQFFSDANPKSMQNMRRLAKRISVEGFTEIEDRTK